jgi:phosphoadenosine phosphosulfate reductase
MGSGTTSQGSLTLALRRVLFALDFDRAFFVVLASSTRFFSRASAKEWSAEHAFMTHAVDDQERIGSQAADPPLLPTPDVLEELAAMSQLLETAEPEAILDWAVSRYGSGFTMATAFGPEGMVILEMLSRISPTTHVFNLDTGYQFPETIALRNKVAEQYKIEVELMKPELTVIEYEKLHGGPLYQRDPNRCCGDRKLAVLTRAALGKYAWASAIRRDQSPDRARASIVGWDKKFHLVKISPLANWTKKQVWDRILKNDIPYNPLHDQGYTSIGCWPCTRAVSQGEDERAGRWSGTGKTECGLHTQD